MSTLRNASRAFASTRERSECISLLWCSLAKICFSFSPESDSFYGVSLDLDLSDLAGKCVRIVGTIETYEDRPAIIIESRDQILPCLGKE